MLHPILLHQFVDEVLVLQRDVFGVGGKFETCQHRILHFELFDQPGPQLQRIDTSALPDETEEDCLCFEVVEEPPLLAEEVVLED